MMEELYERSSLSTPSGDSSIPFSHPENSLKIESDLGESYKPDNIEGINSVVYFPESKLVVISAMHCVYKEVTCRLYFFSSETHESIGPGVIFYETNTKHCLLKWSEKMFLCYGGFDLESFAVISNEKIERKSIFGLSKTSSNQWGTLFHPMFKPSTNPLCLPSWAVQKEEFLRIMKLSEDQCLCFFGRNQGSMIGTKVVRIYRILLFEDDQRLRQRQNYLVKDLKSFSSTFSFEGHGEMCIISKKYSDCFYSARRVFTRDDEGANKEKCTIHMVDCKGDRVVQTIRCFEKCNKLESFVSVEEREIIVVLTTKMGKFHFYDTETAECMGKLDHTDTSTQIIIDIKIFHNQFIFLVSRRENEDGKDKVSILDIHNHFSEIGKVVVKTKKETMYDCVTNIEIVERCHKDVNFFLFGGKMEFIFAMRANNLPITDIEILEAYEYHKERALFVVEEMENIGSESEIFSRITRIKIILGSGVLDMYKSFLLL